MMPNKCKVCKTCRWHMRIEYDFICINKNGSCYTNWMDYGDSCESWEEK
jgi:hypothetical protein